ncbi:hypothetical protein [Gloeothece verrucosa]|uniref:Uncharacterized protein n=1 Tax=Gloeothece verrucosa (strain PCC 7822) TaxID=497965 RepID=E0U7G0_GLOV7|nr:hypothetical protein [Gloeothece verrucosa]ADN13656.1 conserved hypothetical protein [Gloeothece verrucosa PCC 7822]
MTDILNTISSNPIINDFINDFINSLMIGEIDLLTGLFWLGIALTLSIIGGAIGGMLLAGKDLGYYFSAMMGGLFGPVGVIPATIIGLTILKFI